MADAFIMGVPVVVQHDDFTTGFIESASDLRDDSSSGTPFFAMGSEPLVVWNRLPWTLVFDTYLVPERAREILTR